MCIRDRTMAQEYRGCRKLVYAEVKTDTAEGMTFGEVKPFAPVQTISKLSLIHI